MSPSGWPSLWKYRLDKPCELPHLGPQVGPIKQGADLLCGPLLSQVALEGGRVEPLIPPVREIEPAPGLRSRPPVLLSLERILPGPCGPLHPYPRTLRILALVVGTVGFGSPGSREESRISALCSALLPDWGRRVGSICGPAIFGPYSCSFNTLNYNSHIKEYFMLVSRNIFHKQQYPQQPADLWRFLSLTIPHTGKMKFTPF